MTAALAKNHITGQVASQENPYALLSNGERSLIACGLARYEADNHDFNVMMPAAGKYVQVQDTFPRCAEFYKDVAKAWRRFGRLTDRQVIAIMKGMARCPLLQEALVGNQVFEDELVVQYPTVALGPKLLDVPTGFYTIVDDEGHITLRVKQWTPAGEDESKTIIAALVGPHNITDYVAFADIRNGVIVKWGRFSNGYDRWIRAANALFTGDFAKFGMQFALESNCCRRCGAVLTVPTSVHQGYGPECIKHVGG